MKKKMGLEPPSEYENTANSSSYNLAEYRIKENIPDTLRGLSSILARVAAKEVRKNELWLACRMIEKLVEYEIKDTGYYCGKIKISKDFSFGGKNIFWIEESDISCSKKIRIEFEKCFFDKYGLNLRFGSPLKK